MPLRSIATFPITVFLVLLLFAGHAPAASILVWGDSLSAGYGLKADEAWPSLLQTRLAREGFRHTVVNRSVSGETSAGGRSRLPAALAEHKPDILILELGANDGLRGLKPQLLADNLNEMVRSAQQAGTHVLLLGMRMPPNYGPSYTRRFAETFAEIAQTRRIAFVPFLMEGFADRPELYQSDGIHPTAQAQPMILDTVWRELKPLLSAQRR